VGSAIHAALAVYHGTAQHTYVETRIDPRELPLRAVRALNEAFAYLDDHMDHMMEDEKDEVNFFVFRTLRGYCETYADPDPWQTLGTEQEFDLEIFPGIRSTGRIDGLISLNGQRLVLEHKTTSYSPEKFFAEFSNNSQVTRYCKAASILLGSPVHGVLLNILHKPSKRGLGQPKFARHIIVRTQKQIDQLEEDLMMVRRFKMHCEHVQAFPKNDRRCHDYFTQCPYYRLCFGAGETQDNLSYYVSPAQGDMRNEEED
jgi:RecB family exonuclease